MYRSWVLAAHKAWLLSRWWRDDGDATGWAVVVSRTVTWLECGDWDCAVCTAEIGNDYAIRCFVGLLDSMTLPCIVSEDI
jgi:hypothetical protein